MIAAWLAAGVAVAVTALLLSERQGWGAGRWISKPVASMLFIALAVVQGALDHPIGVAILAGLVLSFAGDVALLARSNKRAFLFGLFSFLLAHVVYALAFFMLGGGWLLIFGWFLGLDLVAVLVYVRLRPHIPEAMRVPVATYILVISAMLATAIAAGIRGAIWMVPVGAGLFYLSDLFVARQRFVQARFLNRAIGLPLYYAGQVMIAWSVASVPAAI